MYICTFKRGLELSDSHSFVAERVLYSEYSLRMDAVWIKEAEEELLCNFGQGLRQLD